MITYDISIGSLIVSVVGALLIAIIFSTYRTVTKLVKLIERHEKVLFGDPDLEDWAGLVKICLSNRKYSINDRRAFILLIQRLCRDKKLELDDELEEALRILKTE